MTIYYNTKIYFPSKDKVGKSLNPEIENYVFSIVRDSICRELGGLTVSQVKGFYLNNDNQIIDENITLIQSYNDNLEKCTNVIRNLAKIIKDQLNQESVLIEIDNNPEFI